MILNILNWYMRLIDGEINKTYEKYHYIFFQTKMQLYLIYDVYSILQRVL